MLHATCYIINVNIFIRLPSPATDCNCNAACFGNNMQILITVSAVFALKIANFNNHCVCRCSSVCARVVCRICALFIICKFHAPNIDDEIWGLITSIDRLIVLAHVISMAFIPASQLKTNLYICYIYYIHTHKIEYLHTFVQIEYWTTPKMNIHKKPEFKVILITHMGWKIELNSTWCLLWPPMGHTGDNYLTQLGENVPNLSFKLLANATCKPLDLPWPPSTLLLFPHLCCNMIIYYILCLSIVCWLRQR